MKKMIAAVLAAMLALGGLACAETLVGIPNPWVDTTADGLTEALGLRFGVPEGAENVVYRMLESDSLAEMTFTWEGMDYCARIKPAAEFEDISGLYYEWENVQEDFTVGSCAAWEARARDGETTVDLCLWYDAAPGLMYSICTSADNDLDGFDLLAAAEQVYLPVQGDA